MKIGLLSDTHSYLHPRVFHHFDDCDEGAPREREFPEANYSPAAPPQLSGYAFITPPISSYFFSPIVLPAFGRSEMLGTSMPKTAIYK